MENKLRYKREIRIIEIRIIEGDCTTQQFVLYWLDVSEREFLKLNLISMEF